MEPQLRPRSPLIVLLVTIWVGCVAFLKQTHLHLHRATLVAVGGPAALCVVRSRLPQRIRNTLITNRRETMFGGARFGNADLRYNRARVRNVERLVRKKQGERRGSEKREPQSRETCFVSRMNETSPCVLEVAFSLSLSRVRARPRRGLVRGLKRHAVLDTLHVRVRDCGGANLVGHDSGPRDDHAGPAAGVPDPRARLGHHIRRQQTLHLHRAVLDSAVLRRRFRLPVCVLLTRASSRKRREQTRAGPCTSQRRSLYFIASALCSVALVSGAEDWVPRVARVAVWFARARRAPRTQGRRRRRRESVERREHEIGKLHTRRRLDFDFEKKKKHLANDASRS